MRDVNERERAVIETLTMRLSNQQALEYLETKGYPMQMVTLYKYRKQVRAKTRERLHIIAAETFEQQHLDRIDELLLIKTLMWDNYREEEKPFNKVRILAEIKDIQRYLSQYYEATEDFISDKRIENIGKKYATPEDREKYKHERGDF